MGSGSAQTLFNSCNTAWKSYPENLPDKMHKINLPVLYPKGSNTRKRVMCFINDKMQTQNLAGLLKYLCNIFVFFFFFKEKACIILGLMLATHSNAGTNYY